MTTEASSAGYRCQQASRPEVTSNVCPLKGAAMAKPLEIVNVSDMVDSNRRTFVKGVGMAVLTVQCLPLIARASGTLPNDGKESADNLIIHSGPGLLSHVHDLLIPYALLEAPPLQGVELKTTEALFHRHNIVLTREQLIGVNQGGTVTQKASSHLFVIALAKR